MPSVPTPPVPKQQPAIKDTSVADQSKAGDTHIGTRAKKDTPVSHLPQASQIQKSAVIPPAGISMPMPYHQSQAPVHFGSPNPQIQSQGISTASLQMPLPMPLPIGSASQVQRQVFVPSLQPHPIHPQGIIHQGQNMGFTPQMGHQLPHQLGNMGMGINPQFSPQQGGKFAGARKTTPVKITHPDTHEELRLDKKADAYSDGGPSGARSHSVMPSQSPPAQSFAPSHPISYYPSSSYSTSSVFYPTPNSLPLSSSQITPSSQLPRFNYGVSQGPQNVSYANSSSHNPPAVNITVTPIPGSVESPNPEFSRDVPIAISSTPSGVSSVTIKPSGGSGVVDPSLANSIISGAQKGGSPSSSVTSSDASLLPSSSAVSDDSVSVVSNDEGRKKDSISRSNSLKENQTKLQKKGQLQHQVHNI